MHDAVPHETVGRGQLAAGPRRRRRRCCRRAGWPRSGRAARGCRPGRSRSCPRCPRRCTLQSAHALRAAADAVDAELPVRHSLVAAQGWPRRFLLPQRLVCGSQMLPAAGSRRRPCRPPCRPCAVADVRGAADCRRRLADAGAVAGAARGQGRLVRSGRTARRTTCPRRRARQAPLPSQKPSVPQLAAPWSRSGTGVGCRRSATLLQVPGDAGSAHDLQVPVQAVAQQTPCAQKPVEHSSVSTQAAPFGLRPHEPLMQTAGARSRRRRCRSSCRRSRRT